MHEDGQEKYTLCKYPNLMVAQWCPINLQTNPPNFAIGKVSKEISIQIPPPASIRMDLSVTFFTQTQRQVLFSGEIYSETCIDHLNLRWYFLVITAAPFGEFQGW
jgi:hypothetical protein